jgi:hypothetical protein
MRGARTLGVAITTLALALAVSGCGSPVAVTSPSLATTVAGAPPLDVSCLAGHLCAARAGYGGPTGLGSPKGTSAF